MKAKASAAPNPLILEKQVRRLIREHDLGAVSFRVVDVAKNIFAYAMVKPGSARATALIREAVAAKGGSATLQDISAITAAVADKPIARALGASFEDALAELRAILATQKEHAA